MPRQPVQPPIQEEQASGPYPAPPSNSTTQQFSRGLGSDMIKAGFGFLGSAFAEEFNDPNLAAPFQEMGVNISSTLQDRWFRKEYEDFVSMSGEAYKKRLGDLNKKVSNQFDMLNRGVYVDESGVTQKLDPTSDKASLIKENLYRSSILETSAATQEYMTAAAKYNNNPYVNKEVANILMQQSQDIQQLIGPSIATAQEGERQKMRESREHANYLMRMPQADTDGTANQNRLKAMSIQEIIEEKGMSGAANYLTSTLDGQERLGPYIASLESSDERRLIEDHKERGIDLVNQGDVLERMLTQGNKKRQQNAAFLALQEAVGDDDPRLQRFKTTTVGREYDIPKVNTTVALSPDQIETQASQHVEQGMEGIAQAMKQGASYDEAVDEVIGFLTQELNQFYGQGSSTTKRIKMRVINELNSKEVRESLTKDMGSNVAKRPTRRGNAERQGLTGKYSAKERKGILGG